MALSGQAGYADQGGEFNPRFAGLISDTFMGGKLGVLFSAAFGSRNTLQLGFDTTRFENDNTAQNAAHTAAADRRLRTTVAGRAVAMHRRPSVLVPSPTMARRCRARMAAQTFMARQRRLAQPPDCSAARRCHATACRTITTW